MPKVHGFHREERIRRQADFDRVYGRRCVASSDLLTVYGCKNGLGFARLGLSVSRKWGKAVVRNRIRRLFREAFRLSKERLPKGMDLVLVPRQRDGLSLDELLKELPRLANQVAKRCANDPEPP